MSIGGEMNSAAAWRTGHASPVGHRSCTERIISTTDWCAPLSLRPV
jgi:hypothetical protein